MLSLSAVLHLGDIKFEARGNNDAAQITNWETLRKGKYPGYLIRTIKADIELVELVFHLLNGDDEF